MKYEIQYQQGLFRVRLAVCRKHWPPAALELQSSAWLHLHCDWVINRFILPNPLLQCHGLPTDGLSVLRSLEEAGICLHYCWIQISLCRLRRLRRALLRWISYRVKIGGWGGRERRHIQSRVTQLVSWTSFLTAGSVFDQAQGWLCVLLLQYLNCTQVVLSSLKLIYK